MKSDSLFAADPELAFYYARDIIKSRFPEGESIIATNPEYAYRYAHDVIKGRFLEGEVVIMFSEYYSDYAKLCGLDQYEPQ
jgi:1,2-phenylacetyl-CoA epoxidase PaaB subunit